MINTKNLIIGIAIFILTISAGVYSILTLYGNAPEYEKYCPQINTEKECNDFGANWTNYPAEAVNSIPPKTVPASPNGYCDVYAVCNPKLRTAQESYSKKIFLTALPLGIIVIIIGTLIFGLLSVGGGLMAGGVGIIVYGTFGYWRFAENWMKFVFSLIGLVIIIWLAYFFNKKFAKKK